MDLHHLFSVFFPHSPSLFLCVVTLRNWKTVITHRGLEFHVLFRAASAFAGHVHPSSSMSLGPVFFPFLIFPSFSFVIPSCETENNNAVSTSQQTRIPDPYAVGAPSVKRNPIRLIQCVIRWRLLFTCIIFRPSRSLRSGWVLSSRGGVKSSFEVAQQVLQKQIEGSCRVKEENVIMMEERFEVWNGELKSSRSWPVRNRPSGWTECE